MRSKFILIYILALAFSTEIYSQEKIFYNRIHLFEHQDCQHPIGTVIEDKVIFGNNTDTTTFMSFFNSESEVVNVDMTSFGKYTAFNQFTKAEFLAANTILMGFREGVPDVSESVKQARSNFRVDKVKDTVVNDKSLKHIRIEPKDTLAHRFESYNIFVNTEAETETPLFTSPTMHFLLKGGLKDLKGTVVETYFIDLEGNLYCRDVLTAFQITNKRVTVQ